MDHIDFLLICQEQLLNKWNFEIEDGELLTAIHNVPLIEILININLFENQSPKIIKIFEMLAENFKSMNSLLHKYD